MTIMKKIIIIDGGPRRNMNTAQMLQKFSEEAKRQWRDAHWEDDLQKAFEAGRQIARLTNTYGNFYRNI